jgi:hypothetical protein
VETAAEATTGAGAAAVVLEVSAGLLGSAGPCAVGWTGAVDDIGTAADVAGAVVDWAVTGALAVDAGGTDATGAALVTAGPSTLGLGTGLDCGSARGTGGPLVASGAEKTGAGVVLPPSGGRRIAGGTGRVSGNCVPWKPRNRKLSAIEFAETWPRMYA